MSDVAETERKNLLWKWQTSSPGTFALALVFCLFLLTFLVITPVYDVNDDPAMALVASGYGTVDGPDEHLVYTNVLIGQVLKQLYQITPDFPWYGGYLLTIHFISYWLLLYVLLLLGRILFSLIYFVLFYLVAGIYFLTHLQFTSTAFLLGLSGLFLILTNLILDKRREPHSMLKWGGGLCLIISSLIRFPAVQLLLLASAPFLVVMAFRLFRQVKINSYLAPAFLTVVAVLGSAAYDHQYYQQDKGWQHYKNYSGAVAELVNYAQVPYTDQTKPLFDEIGWSNFDFWMLKSWFYLDPETYNLERIQKFKTRRAEFTLWKFPEVMNFRIVSAKSAFTNLTFLFCFLGAIIIVRQQNNNTWQRRTINGMLFWTVLLMLSFLIYLKLPERIYIPLVSFPFFVSIYFVACEITEQNEQGQSKRRLFRRWGIPVLFLLACCLFWNQKQWSEKIVGINHRFKQDLIQLQEEMPDKVFLAWAPFPIDCFLPLDTQVESRDLKYLWLTGRQSTPIFHRRQNEYQIKSPYQDLYETDRLFLISNPVSNRVLKGYLKQHYGVNVAFQEIYKGGNFRVYKVIHRQADPAQSALN